MLLKQYKINQLEFLLPESLVSVSDALHQSIVNHGVLVPPAICGYVVCDGHRRIAACRSAGIENIFCMEVSGSPGLLFAELNSQREFGPFEAAAAFRSLNQTEQTQLLKQTGLSESPQMRIALQFIADEILGDTELLKLSMPVNIWRELGHLGDAIARFGKSLLTLPGTVAEKRNIAALLRQSLRRDELPASLPGNNAPEVLANLQKTAQPRRSGALEKFENAVNAAKLPPGVSIKIDPSFALPGMQVTINLTRNHIDRLNDTREAVESIFVAVPEL